MIVERLVWKVKPGKQAEFVAMLLPYVHDANNPLKRVYTPKIGTLDAVVAESEFASFAEWQKIWDLWHSPAKAAEVARENELATMVESTIWDPVA